nr:MAG TPA: hypothetical protein [Caudoviricetes sp.]
MRYAVFQDGQLTQALDHVDNDAIIVAMNGQGVDVRDYNRFISGETNILESVDGYIEIIEYEDEWFVGMLDKQIRETERTLRWLESLREDYDVKSD